MDMIRKQKIIVCLAVAGFIAGGGISSAVAQSYPGLTSAPSQQGETGTRNAPQQEQPGYSGLVPGATAPEAPSRPQAQQPQAPEAEASRTDRPHRRNDAYYGQTPDQQAVRQRPAPVRTAEDIKEQSRFNNIRKQQDEENIELGAIKINERALEVINQPLEMIDGMYPQEYNAMTFVNMKFDEINKLPANQQGPKLDELRHFLEVMVDNNNSKLTAPNAVFRRIGMKPEAIDAHLREAEAVNAKLEPILAELKGQEQ